MLNLSPPRTSIKINNQPNWLLDHNNINLSLSKYKKSTTSSTEHIQHFLATFEFFKSNDWLFIYSDASKTDKATSFAVTKQNGDIITGGLLPDYTSIFTAEATAILYAIKYAINYKGKFIICSDSFSCVKATQNTSNTTPIIAKIRDLIIKYKTKTILFWVPGHVGIRGNEQADAAANYFNRAPTHLFPSSHEADLAKLIKNRLLEIKDRNWNNIHHRSVFESDVPRFKSSIFTRLRIGHTKLTHQHLLLNEATPQCQFCNDINQPYHILTACPILERIRKKHFGSDSPIKYLKDVNNYNINTIYNFLVDCKLHNKI